MTFEERIDRLTERHEAMAQSMELLAIQMEETRQFVDNLAVTTAALVARADKQSKDIELMTQSVLDLVTVARGHDKRIAGLEAA